jgi:hypothetical protein
MYHWTGIEWINEMKHQENITEVDKFIYLGSVISKDGWTDEDIKSRINKARHAFRTNWGSSALSQHNKIRGPFSGSATDYGHNMESYGQCGEKRSRVGLNPPLEVYCDMWSLNRYYIYFKIFTVSRSEDLFIHYTCKREARVSVLFHENFTLKYL